MPQHHNSHDPTSFKNLLNLAGQLRAEGGCPWDRKQTLTSMIKHLKNEANEIEEAVKNEDYGNLSEEIGDVLFQLVMMIQIAKEEGHFDAAEVLTKIDDKIRSRHTWVFGDDVAETAEEALALWKKNKEREK